MNAAVYLNGHFIGDGGNMNEPLGRNWNRPLLFVLPGERLRTQGNTLHIHLRGNAYTQAVLYPLEIAEEAVLRPKYERALFFNVSLNQSASLLIAFIGALMLSLWARRRQEIAYAYFGTAALIWAVQSTNLYMRDVPFSTAQWETFVNASFEVFAVLLLASILRFIGAWRDAFRPWILLLLIGSPLSLLLVPAEHFLQVTALWHFGTLAFTLLTLVKTLHAAIWGNRDARLLLVAMSLIMLLALHDWTIHSAHLFGHFTERILGGGVFLLQYGAPILFMSIGWIMTNRYLRTLTDFERLNDELDQRVQAREAELEASYARMRELEMEHAVAGERERIHRDLHDDVGAKLLSLVYRADSAENAELARAALQDLRDVVSRSTDDCILAGLAADWRAECEKRLSEAGLQLEWSQAGALENIHLSPPQALHIGRVLREAVSNAIRHADARQVEIRLVCEGARLCLDLRDDGRGCPDVPRRGSGLRNMAARAQRLGAILERYSVPGGGCGVRLDAPLDAPVQ
jgi:signal transduction histidine kinase